MATLHCFYCKGLFEASQITKDHVIPRWVFRYFAEFREDHRAIPNLHGYNSKNHKPSCQKCNVLKGPMPPAEFMRGRQDRLILRALRTRWGHIAQTFATGDGCHDDPDLRAMVVKAFSETPGNAEAPPFVVPRSYMTPEERRRAYWRRRVGHLIPSFEGEPDPPRFMPPKD